MKESRLITWLILGTLAAVAVHFIYIAMTRDLREYMCPPGMCFVTGVPD